MTDSVSSLGYITLNATDLPAWKVFATEVMGLMLNEAASSDTRMVFRMDDHPSRLVVQQGADDSLSALGWEFAGQAAYQAVRAALAAAGAPVAAGDTQGAALRNVVEYSVSADPAGNPFEVYHGRTGLQDNFVSPAGISAFVTGDMGMGHAVVPAPNMDETHDFYRAVMGFGDSDNLTLPEPAEGASAMNIRFMHSDNPRHHSLALFNYPVPSRLVHLILEVNSMDEVGACLDRVNQGGYPLMSTLGRHSNDKMVSFYVVAPGGIAIEFGYDGETIDWDNFSPTVSTAGDIWGHEYVAPALDGA